MRFKILYFIILLFICGCRIDDTNKTKESQIEKDRIAFKMLTAYFNASQTNWIMIISERK